MRNSSFSAAPLFFGHTKNSWRPNSGSDSSENGSNDTQPELIEHFLDKHGARGGHKITGVTAEALRRLEAYAWPGNVRELENVVHRSMIMTSASLIDVESLPPSVLSATEMAGAFGPKDSGMEEVDEIARQLHSLVIGPLGEQIDRLVELAENQIIVAALEKMNHRRQDTADLLGISRKSLHNKMQKYGMLKSKRAAEPPE